MAEESIKVTGLRETVKAFDNLDKAAKTELKTELRTLAEPVAETARGLASQFAGASVSTIRPRASVRGAFVTQGAKKVTGLRPDFGALQMRQVLLPSLAQHSPAIERGVELWLDHIISKEF